MSASIRLAMTLWKPQVIHSHGLLAAHVALMRPARGAPPVIYDMHGAVPEEYRAGPPGRRTAERIRWSDSAERAVVQSANAIVSVSESLERHWVAKHDGGLVLKRIVPCAVNTNSFRFDEQARDVLRRCWSIGPKDPLLVYCGALQAYQQTGQMVGFFSAVRNLLGNAKMLFLVPPADRAEIDALLSRMSLGGSYLVESSTHEDVPKWLSAGDIGLLLRADSIINRVASPTKFAEYLACGLPVLATPFVDSVRDSIADAGVGHIVDHEAEGHVTAAAEFISGVMTRRFQWAAKCCEYADNALSWRCHGKELARLHADLLA